MAFPSISTGSNAWMRAVEVGARLSSTDARDDSSRMSRPPAAPARPSVWRFDVLAEPLSTSFFITNGLNSSSAFLREPHGIAAASGRRRSRTAGVVDPLPQQVLPEPSLLALEHVAEDLSGRLWGRHGPPRRPLSMSASTASCSIASRADDDLGAPSPAAASAGCSG